MTQEFNGFDIIEGIKDPKELAKIQAKEKERFDKIDYLIHQVFEQSKAGKELLNIWHDAIIMSPTVTPNSTQFGAGIEEGKKEFIRSILLTVKKVEADE